MKTNIVSHKLSFKSRILFLPRLWVYTTIFPRMIDGSHLLAVNSL